MNAFLWAATVLLVGLALPAQRCLRQGPLSRMVGLQVVSTVGPTVLLLIAAGSHRGTYFDVALAAALLSFASGLVFARVLERWI
jgi:multisubunit Na+/H+ antiporter MnhF subunit